MKTKSAVLRLIITFTIGIALIVITTMIFSCSKNEHSGTIGTLQLQADTPKSFLRSEAISTIDESFILLKSVQVEVRNLRIEGNSLPNNQSVKLGINGKQKSVRTEFGNTADSLLKGPYILDIFSGTASIDEVPVQPGTYKKVDFEFFAGPDNNNHSIAISGTFTNARGVSVPFSLTSEFSEIIQLPLSGRGLKIKSGNIISITILFDVNNWLNELDFNKANQTNGKITITKDENSGLYSAFMTQMLKHIDIKKELLNN
ncbi:MAG: hypothetical protein WAO52_14580 [Prolixibacteraceae bacterium]